MRARQKQKAAERWAPNLYLHPNQQGSINGRRRQKKHGKIDIFSTFKSLFTSKSAGKPLLGEGGKNTRKGGLQKKALFGNPTKMKSQFICALPVCQDGLWQTGICLMSRGQDGLGHFFSEGFDNPSKR